MSRAQRYRMVVAYDGTAYAGWQIQPNGVTVQAMLQQCLARITGEAPLVHGSGRTDQGVHAAGQVAHFDLAARKDPAVLSRALNALLPADIRVVRVARARGDFHARRSAVCKEYRYFIWNDEIVPPFVCRYRARIAAPLDLAAMRRAAGILCGRQDFAAFTANPNRVVDSTVRHLMDLTVTRRGREFVIRAVGDGFLYKMVRSLAGWLIRVGDGSVSADLTREVLESRTRTARVPTAPPEGLFLWRVKY